MIKVLFLLLSYLFVGSTSCWAYKFKDPELADKINPHWTSRACLQCHLEKPEKGKKSTFKFGGDINKLCNSCHDTVVSRYDEHVVGVPIIENEYFKLPPSDFPLDNGKLTCITCHDPRLQEKPNTSVRDKNRQFLRRAPFEIMRTFEWAKSEFDSRHRQSRYVFCFFCHKKEKVMAWSPHKNHLKRNGDVNEDMCLFCHLKVPDRTVFNPNENRYLTTPLEAQCKSCHMGKTRLHPIRVNHYGRMPPDRIVQQIKYTERRAGTSIPLVGGRVVCSSCHNAHQRGVMKNPITKKGADARKRLRVEGYSICLACHGESVGTPISGRPF